VREKLESLLVVFGAGGAAGIVLALPAGFPHRERLVTIVFGVTIVTLVIQALPFTRLLRALGVTVNGPDAAREAARARLIAARRGLADLEELLLTGIASRHEHAHRMARSSGS
jgi:monovalent cation:H+ antiporter, CPA1 family